MATEPRDLRRRRSVAALLGWMAAPLLPSRDALAAATNTTLLAAAWTLRDDEARAQLGVLSFAAGAARTTASVDLPGRAHGLLALPDGSLLAVARRPGDWLLRWHPASGAPRWHWIEPDRAFTGHALLDAEGRRLYTGETDLDSGRGLVGVRDAQSLAKLAEWPTHGSDPHALSWDAEGRLIVANGGIASRPETGRRKLALDRMDASLVRLAPDDGRLLGQWRLDDERLSIRHLAWSADARGRPQLGIALQAEHASDAQRATAPVLAVFDGERLKVAAQGSEPEPLGGYGGDIAALASGFVVSCPRAGGTQPVGIESATGQIARWSADGQWRGTVAWPQACALATAPDRRNVWCGGDRAGPLAADEAERGERHALARLRLDNHWLRLR